MSTIKRLRELEAKHAEAWRAGWNSTHSKEEWYTFEATIDLAGAMADASPALLGVAEAAAKIARMVGDGNSGAGRLITAGECKELWDALKRLEDAC